MSIRVRVSVNTLRHDKDNVMLVMASWFAQAPNSCTWPNSTSNTCFVLAYQWLVSLSALFVPVTSALLGTWWVDVCIVLLVTQHRTYLHCVKLTSWCVSHYQCGAARDGHLLVTYRSVCDRDQELWSVKTVLDHLTIPFWSSWLLNLQEFKGKKNIAMPP